MSELAAVTRNLLASQRVETTPGSSIVFRAGDGTTPPTLAFKVEPEYTDEARFAKYSGTVVITTEVGPDGLAHNTRVKKGIGLGLDENALAAINAWRFNPGKRDGTPVTVLANIEVNFRLM